MQAQRHDPVSKLIFELSKLPGIGEKTATRLAYFVLKQDIDYVQNLSSTLMNAKQNIELCHQCFTLTDINPCRICSNPDRDIGLICIVERPSDVFSVEQAGSYKGKYHVLHGALSPLDGIGPEELKIREFLARLDYSFSKNSESHSIREVILAMNPSVEGEATSMYLARLTKPLGIKVTKLAHGIPVGGMLEYTDKQTISKAIENRMEVI